MKKNQTVKLFLLVCCFVASTSVRMAAQCATPTCDPANPDFCLILTPEITATNGMGMTTQAQFNVFVQNKSGGDLDLRSISFDLAVNTGSLPSLQSITSDAADFPNSQVFNTPPGNFVFIFDDFPQPLSTNIGGVSYDQLHSYDHIIAGPVFAPQSIPNGFITQVMTIYMNFTGVQTFDDSDVNSINFLGQNNYFHVYSGQCVDPQNNINNSFGFEDATGTQVIGDCYGAYITSAPIFLAVDLVRLEGFEGEGYNQLSWSTTTETDMEWYIIERTSNPLINDFTEVGRLPATGNSSSLITYSWKDETPLSEGYYRIRSVDLEGKGQISEVVFLKQTIHLDELSVFPNPSKGLINYQYSIDTPSRMTVRIYDTLGQMVESFTNQETEGSITQSLDLGHLKSGLYYLEVSDGRNLQTTSFILY